MKFIKFERVNIDKEGKVESLGRLLVRDEHIRAIQDVWDMHELVVKDACLLILTDAQITIRGDADEMVDYIVNSVMHS